MIGGKKIAVNTLLLIISSLFNVGISIFTTSIIAKSIGPELYGRYTFGLNYILFFSVLSNFGLESLFIRETARDNKSINLINDILHLKIILAIFTIGIIIFSIHILNYSPAIVKVIYILCFGLLFQILSEVLLSVYRAIEKMRIIAIFSIVLRVISAVIIVIAIYSGIGFIGIVSAFSLAIFLTFVAILMFFYKDFKVINLSIKPHRWISLIKQGLPFFVSALLTMFYHKINILMLSKMVGEREMGFYMASVSLMGNLFFLHTAFNASIFPAYSRVFENSADALKKTYEKTTKYLIILTIAVSVGTVLVGGRIIQLIYGEEFIPAIPALNVLIFFWALAFFTQTQSSLLFSIQKEMSQVKIMGLACIINTVLNLILIRKFGIIGAAYSSVITEALVAIVITGVLWRLNLRYKPDFYILRLVVVVLAMIVAVKLLLQVNILVAVTGGAAFYVSLLFILRVFDSEDMFYFKSLIKRKAANEQ